jgi:hypothetical protein
MLTEFELFVVLCLAKFAIANNWQSSPMAGGVHYHDAERIATKLEAHLGLAKPVSSEPT